MPDSVTFFFANDKRPFPAAFMNTNLTVTTPQIPESSSTSSSQFKLDYRVSVLCFHYKVTN